MPIFLFLVNCFLTTLINLEYSAGVEKPVVSGRHNDDTPCSTATVSNFFK